MKICLYGPSGSGKSTVGELLANRLGLPFFDLDQEIEARAAKPVAQIFAEEGEQGFRLRESAELRRILAHGKLVLALGGGSLLDVQNRELVENNAVVICLSASTSTLVQRLSQQNDTRPLLSGNLQDRLASLLVRRSAHYASFPRQLDTTGLQPQQAAWKAQVIAGRFRVSGMGVGYDVQIQNGVLDRLGQELLGHAPPGPVALVSDDQVAALYGERARASLQSAGYDPHLITFPAGEKRKNLTTLSELWDCFSSARLDRGSMVVALGGGVVTDLAGFAAATYLRGVRWAAVPTSLLGMVDASLGGKTGLDLPQGKNLVGAFYPPELILVDPQVLTTLTEIERRNGLGEVVKHAVIADPLLFAELEQRWEAIQPGRTDAGGSGWINRAIAVKIQLLEEDPYEKSRRVILNLGHTVGHALEWGSGYRLRHGEAVAIGLVVEAQIGESLGITQAGISEKIARVLSGLGLPVCIPPDIEIACLRLAFGVDKKRQSGKVKLPLPETIGKISPVYEIEEEKLWSLFLSCTGRTLTCSVSASLRSTAVSS